MAKRKRLTPAQPDYLETESPVPETKPMGFPATRAPIAQVAGETSAAAALQELAGEMTRARDEGRLILALEEHRIDAGYLVRDRMLADDEELRVLMESLRARGQQTPIEVVKLDQDRFGLISGWRRLTALRRLLADTGDARFATVQAILRRPETAADAYVAMVEENEIRVGLSHYERARVAAKAVEQGVYADEKQALRALFGTASRAKRSKIGSFLTLYRAGDDVLNFPTAIPERLGMALAKALAEDPSRVTIFQSALRAATTATAEAELARLGELLAEFSGKPSSGSGTKSRRAVTATPEAAGSLQIVPGVDMSFDGRRVTLSGAGVTAAFRKRLLDWIRAADGAAG